jgi:hypothetical protein
MEIVVESSSITEIPSVLPFFCNVVPCCEILDKMKRRQKNGIEIKIHWTPGHANVNGNEIADRLAKEAAKEAQQNQLDSHNTITKHFISIPFFCILFILSKISSVILLLFSIFQCRVSIPIAV